MSGCRNFYLDELNQMAAASDIATKSKDLRYIGTLECQFMCMQRELMQLTTRYAHLQFRLRQMIEASTDDEQDDLLSEMETMLFTQLLEHECYKITHRNTEMLSEDDHYGIFGDMEDKVDTIVAQLRDRLVPLDELSIELEEECAEADTTAELVEEDSSALRCNAMRCSGKGKKSKEKDAKPEPKPDRENESTEKLHRTESFNSK